MKTKEELKLEVAFAQAVLCEAQKQLYAFESTAENNVFDSLEIAEDKLTDILITEAAQDCEGAHNCGNPSYSRQFIVDGKKYLGRLTVEYDRHDKTYYYIDGADFSFTLLN